MSDSTTNNGYSPWSEYADLDAYARDATPRHAFGLNLDTLANGDYDFVIENASLEHLNSNRVVRLLLKITSTGEREVEHLYWLNKQEGINGFLAEMLALGFPARTWGDPARGGLVPLSVAIPDCVKKLPGIRFRGTKSSRVDTRPGKQGTVYHDLRISGRIGGQAMPAQPTQQPAPQPKILSEEQLPF